jgi:hypothetical protein
MLFKFGMAKCKPISTPLDRTVKLHPDSGRVCDPTQFRQIIGSLIYLTITRPDVSYPVRVISQYMARPTEEHLQSALRILRYVSDTKDRGLLYRAGTTVQLAGYTDADWAGNAADRRSTSGYAFSIWSAAIVWSSKKQPTVALSSTEAEYRGAAVATCEAIWVKRLLKDLHEEVSDPTVIYCDNLSNIQLAKNIEVHYHFVRERVLSGDVELRHVPTDRQVADIFTKALGLDKLRQFLGALGLHHLDVPNFRGREPEAEPEPEGPGLRADRSEKAESESEVDSDVPNQPGESPERVKSPGQIRTHGRIRRTHRKRHGRDNNKAVKGKVSTGGLAATGRKGRWGSDR